MPYFDINDSSMQNSRSHLVVERLCSDLCGRQCHFSVHVVVVVVDPLSHFGYFANHDALMTNIMILMCFDWLAMRPKMRQKTQATLDMSSYR